MSKDLIGDVESLSGVVLADAVWHEEAFDNAEDCGDAGPKEDEVEDACGVSAEVKVVDAECAKEEREQDASRLVFAGAFVLGIEPCALLVGHAGSVERIGDLHDFAPLMTHQEVRCVMSGGSPIVDVLHRFNHGMPTRLVAIYRQFQRA